MRKATFFRVLGLLTIAVLAGVVALAGAIYQQVFTAAMFVSVSADRSGLLLDKGAAVQVRGVQVGDVRDVRLAGDGVLLTVALNPDLVRYVSADVTAQIVPTTVFGAKFVELSAPPAATQIPIAAGAVIPTDSVNVEANTLFQNLMTTLTAVQPAKLSEAIGNVAETLRGQGYQIGDYFSRLHTYLGEFNPSLGDLGTDFARAPGVLNTYTVAAPGFVSAADNFSTTAHTIAAQQGALHAFLLDMTGLSTNSANFLKDSETPLTSALSTLAPTTRVLAKYAPEFPCTFGGLNYFRKLGERGIGGVLPGLNGFASFLPAGQPYTSPQNLPKVKLNSGPNCHDQPDPRKVVPPHVSYDTGADPYPGNTDAVQIGTPPLAVRLFGPEAMEVFGK